MSAAIRNIIIVIISLFFLLFSSLYVVPLGSAAVVVHLGVPKKQMKLVGYHWHWPLLERVYVIDQRNQLLKVGSLSVMTAKQNNLTLNSFVLWRVVDPINYYQQFLTSMHNGDKWIAEEVNAFIASKAASSNEWNYLMTNQASFQDELIALLRKKSADKGIEISDLGFMDIRVSTEIQNVLLDNMLQHSKQAQEDLKKSSQLRADALRINATREANSRLAQAQADALAVKRKAEEDVLAKQNTIYKRDPEFYIFYHRMQAYQTIFTEKDWLVLDSKSSFFQYLTDPNKQKK